MALTPAHVFAARPELRSYKLRDIQNWVENVLNAAELRHQAEQVEVYQLDPALTGIALPFSANQLDQIRDRIEWLPLLESTARARGWHYVQVDFAKSAIILAMYKRICYVHQTCEEDCSAGITVGLMHGETPEALVERIRRDGLWVDTEDGRVWHSPQEIVEISFPAESLVPVE